MAHKSLDSCPYYYGLTSDECEQRRAELKKNLNEINLKLTQIKNEINSTVTKRLHRNNSSSSSLSSSMQQQNSNEYFKKINKQRVNERITSAVTLTPTKSHNQNLIPQLDDLNVSKYDLDLFRDALMLAPPSQTPFLLQQTDNDGVFVVDENRKFIQFGAYEIETWYKSPSSR